MEEGPHSLAPAPGEWTWTKTPGLLDPSLVRDCADYFFARMLGTVPILTRDAFQRHADRIHECGSSYCLVVAFCAFVLIQTGYHSTQPSSSDQAYALLEEATVARRHWDPFASPIQQGIITSFLLYGCHIGLAHQRHAYYFLREATTLYTADVMDSSGVTGQDSLASSSSRLFWLLLVSER